MMTCFQRLTRFTHPQRLVALLLGGALAVSRATAGHVALDLASHRVVPEEKQQQQYEVAALAVALGALCANSVSDPRTVTAVSFRVR